MDEKNLDRMIRDTLKSCAEGIDAPETLGVRVKFAVNAPAPAPRRRPVWMKRAVAVLAVAALAAGGALAAGRVASISSHTYHDKAWATFVETERYAKKIAPEMKYPEAFSNGYSFMEGNTETASKNDEDGNSLGLFTDLYLTYGKDGKTLYFEAGPTQDDLTYTSPFDTVRNVGDVDVRYRAMENIFLPPDGSELPTEEEQAKADAGEINIGYGTETREEKTFYSVKWEEDGIQYSISTFDPGELTEEDFFQMAAEVINA